MNPFSVIVKPIVSEKSNGLRESNGKYTFEVRREASKADIKRAVEKAWGVKVGKIATLIRRDKIKRRGQYLSKPGKSKRAYVTLAEGQKLPLFEDQ